MSEAVGIGAETLLHDIGDEGRDCRPGSRHDADHEPDRAAARNGLSAKQPIGARQQQVAKAHPDRLQVVEVFEGDEHLGDAEDPDGYGKEIEAVYERYLPKRQAIGSGDRIGTDHRDQEPERRDDQCLHHGPAA
jgi:hypothetical protein